MSGAINRAVAKVSTICDEDAGKLYNMLVRVGVGRLGLDEQTSHDLAAETLITAIEREWKDGSWAVVEFRRAAWRYRRTSTFRNDRSRLNYDESNEPLELTKSSIAGTQDQYVRMRRIDRALDEMPEDVRNVMHLVAREWTHEEISSHLKIGMSTVRKRTAIGRRLLLDRLGEDLLPPKERFRGVEKQGRQYRAKIVYKAARGWASKHIGLYETAREAALAYDEAALEMLGHRARLNFPEKLAA